MTIEDQNNPINNEDNGFALPEDYFQNSAKAIQVKLEWEEELIKFPVLFKVKKPGGFLLPEDYFEKNEVRFEKRLYPLIDAHNTNTGFDLPKDYFKAVPDHLAYKILEKVPTVKVIQLSRSFIPWAIAALLIVSVGIWIYSVVSPTDGQTDCNTLACLERKEILNSGNLEDLENEELYQMVNPVSLEKNIKNHIIIGQDIRDTSDDSSNNDLLEDL